MWDTSGWNGIGEAMEKENNKENNKDKENKFFLLEWNGFNKVPVSEQFPRDSVIIRLPNGYELDFQLCSDGSLRLNASGGHLSIRPNSGNSLNIVVK